MKVQKVGAKSATADSCFGLIWACQCNAALGRPATSNRRPKALKVSLVEGEFLSVLIHIFFPFRSDVGHWRAVMSGIIV